MPKKFLGAKIHLASNCGVFRSTQFCSNIISNIDVCSCKTWKYIFLLQFEDICPIILCIGCFFHCYNYIQNQTFTTPRVKQSFSNTTLYSYILTIIYQGWFYSYNKGIIYNFVCYYLHPWNSLLDSIIMTVPVRKYLHLPFRFITYLSFHDKLWYI